MEGLFFYIFGTLAVIAALATITRRDPVTSAFWLIFCFLNVAALFAVLQAHLMAVLQQLRGQGAADIRSCHPSDLRQESELPVLAPGSNLLRPSSSSRRQNDRRHIVSRPRGRVPPGQSTRKNAA